jgi:hypothetical protein
MKLRAKMNEAIGFGSIDKPAMKPPKFPMKLKVFLRRAFGGRLHSDRLYLFRKFLKSEYSFGHEDMPEKLLETFSKSGITSSKSYYGFIQQIKQWRKINRVRQRQTASKSRWLKEARKKLLRLLHGRINALSQQEKCSLASKKGKKVTGSHRKK